MFPHIAGVVWGACILSRIFCLEDYTLIKLGGSNE